MKKKMISLLLAAVAASGAFALAACGGTDKKDVPTNEVKPIPTANSVDTFVGVASSKTYSGELKAVEAFFTDELDGEYVG